MKKSFLFVSLIFVFVLSGCATVKGLLGMNDKPEKMASSSSDGDRPTRFSDNNYMPPAGAREYHHTTKQKLEEESQLQAQAGSMWVMEGQGSYLFTQNKVRREGDLLTVKLEGAAQKQVETKVSVIRKLLKQLEDEEKRARDMQQQQIAPEQPKLADGTPAAPGAAAPARAPAAVADDKKEKEEEVKIDSVPTRIVERQADGNYRIKGQTPFMIGNKEYKVIVTGIIRPEEFNDEGVSSGKLLDSQYDVVSIRRKE